MKKILATVLSACLLVGMAVPAFAEYSSQSGTDSETKMLEFAKGSYTIKIGDEIDLYSELTAFASPKKLVQSPNVQWSIENDTKYAFSLGADGLLLANEESGTATVVAKTNDGKVTAKAKVSATRASIGGATSFSFENNTYSLLTGADATLLEKDQTIDIIPMPKGTTFTQDQVSEIISAVNIEILNGNFNIVGSSVAVTPSVTGDAKKISIVYPNGSASNVTEARYQYGVEGSTSRNVTARVGGESISIPDGNNPTQVAEHIANQYSSPKWNAKFENGNSFSLTPDSSYRNANPGNLTFTGSGITAMKYKYYPATVTGDVLGGIGDTSVSAKTFEIEVFSFPSAADNTKVSRVRKTVSIGCKPAVGAVDINAPTSTITVKVGEKVSMKAKYRLSPSNSNVASSWQFSRDYLDANSQYDDFAVFTDNPDDASEIIGVAVGRNKISASIIGAAGETKTARIIVNVVEKGASTSTPDTDPTKPSLTFTEGNTSVGGTGFTIVVNGANGAAITYKMLNAAIAKVDANGKVTPIAAGQTKVEISIDGITEKLYCTVNVKSATATLPGGTDVPQTGIETLAKLI